MSEDGFSDSFEEPHIEIQIKTLMGTMFDVRVNATDTVGDIKRKICRVEGIPVYQQNLIYHSQELKDSARLDETGIQNGSTLTLVSSMRGGPISTRRLSISCEHYILKELKDLLETAQDEISQNSKVSVLVFKEGDIINLLRVIENEDGSYSPYNEGPISPPKSKRDTLEAFERLVEDTEMCTKIANLRKKMDALNVKKQTRTRTLSSENKEKLSYRFFEECAENLLKEADLTVFEKNPLDEGNQSESEEIALKDKHRSKALQPIPLPKPKSKTLYSEKRSYSHIRQNYTKLAKKRESSGYITYSRDRISEEKPSLLPSLEKLSISDKSSENPYLLEGLNANKLPDMRILDGSDDYLDETQGILGNIGGMDQKNDIYRPIIPENTGATLMNALPSISGAVESSFMAAGFSKQPSYSLASTSTSNITTTSLPNLSRLETHHITNSRGESPILGATATELAEQLQLLDDDNYGESLTMPTRNRVHLTRLVLSSEGERPKSSPNSIELEEHARDTWEIHEPASERLKHSATCKVGLLKRRQDMDFMENSHKKTEVINLRGKYSASTSSTKYTVYSGPQVYMPSHLMTPSAIPPEYAPKIQPKYCERVIFHNANQEARSPLYSRKNRNSFYETSIERFKNEDRLFGPKDEFDADNKEELFGYYNLSCVTDLFEKENVEDIKLPPVIKKKSRCNECNKRLNITNIYNCRCGRIFCSQHRYSEVHRCTYDYKTEGRKILERQNPLVTAEKVRRF